MTTEQRDDTRRMVKRTCKVILRNGKPCEREYRVPTGSKSKGCPECCPECCPRLPGVES